MNARHHRTRVSHTVARTWLVVASVLPTAACAASAQQASSSRAAGLAASSPVTRPTSDSTPPLDDRDPIAAATREYRAHGAARTVVQGSVVTFPFGHAQPTLTCTVLRACIIELQAGEIVLSRISGDTQRWEITPAVTGPEGHTTLIVVKPRDCDITTNLVLATDRRLYDLTLDSPPCPAKAASQVGATNPQQAYVQHVRFYYPDETVATWAQPRPVTVASDVLALNFAYRVKKGRAFPWSPAQVFDDGAHLYVKLPDSARASEAPVLFARAADGTRTLLNYSVVGGDTYVTDRLVDRAVLIAGVDGKEQTLLIERTTGGGR